MSGNPVAQLWSRSQTGSPRLNKSGQVAPLRTLVGTESCPESELVARVEPPGSQSLTLEEPRARSQSLTREGGTLRVQATMKQLADPQHSAVYFRPHGEQELSASWELLAPPSAGTGKWEALAKEQSELKAAQGGRHSPPVAPTSGEDRAGQQTPRAQSSPPKPLQPGELAE